MTTEHDDNRPAPTGTSQFTRGMTALGFDAVDGVTRIVEHMYRNIAARPLPWADEPQGPARGAAGLVHSGIRNINAILRNGVDEAFELFAERLDRIAPGPGREAVVAAVNGVIGDHLHDTGNPLAIPMTLRSQGQPLTLEPEALATAFPEARTHLLVTIHGLCMNDLHWRHRGHHHAEVLAPALDASVVDVQYNSGRHISDNGALLAHRLQALVDAWPTPVKAMTLLCHSMGGLVARSAVYQSESLGLDWPARLRALAFLGTPHHGAPLERGGHWLNTLAGSSPYTAPLGRLGWLRSSGITDLRHANLTAADWQGRDRFADADTPPAVIPLPGGVRCVAVAAQLHAADSRVTWAGDGLVPVDSALGRCGPPERHLQFEPERMLLRRGLHHWALLSDAAVSRHLLTHLT